MHAAVRAIFGPAAGFGPAPRYRKRRRDPIAPPCGVTSADALAPPQATSDRGVHPDLATNEKIVIDLF
jgi:hypothetical protein